MRDFSQDHRWLSINTATIRKSKGVELPLPQIIEACVERDIRAISPWRDQVAAAGLPLISRLVKQHGLELSGYCRGGMFTATDAGGLQAAHDDNRRAVDEARELNAKCLVLVVGALPGALAGKAAHKNLALARDQVTDGIAQLLEYARSAEMPLAIEPLHPMYAADRACINTMEQALDVCDDLDPGKTGALGVAVVIGKPDATSDYLGILAMLICVTSWATTQAFIPIVAKDHGTALYAAIARYAAPQMIVMALLVEGQNLLPAIAAIPFQGWLGVIGIAAFGFALPYSIWYWLLMRHRIDELTPFTLLMPVFGVATATWQLGEKLSEGLVLGGSIILAGLAIVVWRWKPKAEPIPPA